jgi:small-conductance mechanosensitive channel
LGAGDENLASEISHEASHAIRGLTWQRGVTVLAVLVGSYAVAKISARLLRRVLSRRTGWSGPAFALSKLLNYILVFIGVLATLGLLGVPLSTVLLTSSALLVGVGFALQHVAQDFIAGLILLIGQPIRRNDFVTFGQTEGTVQEISLRATHLITVDGTNVVVPNHLLVTTELANHSHPILRARMRVEVPVSLHEDVEVVTRTLASVAADHPGVLDEPAPIVRLTAIRNSEFRFTLLAWTSDPPARVRVASELRCAIAQAFARIGIHFPTPELRLHGGQPARDHDGLSPDPGAP